MWATNVPVTPDADTAREWARQELEDPIYSQGQTIADIFAQAVADFLERVFSGGGVGDFPVLGVAIALVAVIVLAIATIAIVKPVLDNRRKRASVVLEDDDRSARDIRAASETAAAAADWDLAVLERYRAVIVALEERLVIDERAGRTAYEAARDAGNALPACARDLVTASRTFDEVCYGHRPATEGDYRSLVTLDSTVQKAKPAVYRVDA